MCGYRPPGAGHTSVRLWITGGKYMRTKKNSFFPRALSPCQVASVRLPPSAYREIAPPRAAAHRHGRTDLAGWPRRRARAIPAHPASDCGVGKDAPVEEHSLPKPCCSRRCTRLLTAEQNHKEIPSSRSAIAIANADGPNPKTQTAALATAIHHSEYTTRARVSHAFHVSVCDCSIKIVCSD